MYSTDAKTLTQQYKALPDRMEIRYLRLADATTVDSAHNRKNS